MPVRFQFDFEKAFEALVYLASRSEDVLAFDKYKAAKLLFLADKYHLVRYGRPILGDEYRALPYGPIPQTVLNLLNLLMSGVETPQTQRLAGALEVDRRFKYPRLKAAGAVGLDALSKSDLLALDHVIALHGRKSFDELVALTHSMVAYRKPWAARPEGGEMAEMAYEDFFEEDADAIAGALEEMLETAELREAFPEQVEL